MKERKRDKPKLSFRETLKISWQPYRRLYAYVTPYRWRFIIGILCGVGAALVNSLFPIVVAKVMSFIFNGAMPSRSALLHDTTLLNAGPKIDSIGAVCLAIPAIFLARSALGYANGYFMNWVSNKVVTDIRVALFTKIVNQSMDYFNQLRAGYLMSRITYNTKGMQLALTAVSSDLFKQPFQVVAGAVVLFLMDWRFTLVTLILFPTALIPLRIYGRKARQAVRSDQENSAQMAVTMSETFAGIRVIKSFTREEHQTKSFRKTNDRQFSASMKMVKATEAVGPLIETIAAIGVGLALAYVYFMNISAGRFFGLITGIFMLYEPLKTLSKLHIVMQRSAVATTDALGILDSAASVQDAPDAIDLSSSEGRVSFENVTFRYSSGVSDAVKDITLEIKSGRSYALVGASGAGKSTILSLLLRLYDPTHGTIRIDGADLRHITQKSLREQIGLVSQETFLFHDTIFKNIQFGRLDATAEEIYDSARTAFAHDFIIAQPNGYDTMVGDKGMMLSGGQQQRLAIARAVLKNAPILLLDEATSALDSESENQIQLALERLSQGRTVIAIAHRLSTILSADQIVVMDHGRIKDVGTHAELLEKSSYYRRLYDMQFNRQNDDDVREPALAEVMT